jgi:hypothetical protein
MQYQEGDAARAAEELSLWRPALVAAARLNPTLLSNPHAAVLAELSHAASVWRTGDIGGA